jgi:predicted transcriptional regulator of viral defense system
VKFDELIAIIGDDPVFESSVLRVGDVDPRDVATQLSRWMRSGRVEQLRRGLYVVAAPYARRRVEPFAIANRLVTPSYVSEESALSWHGLIPDVVHTVSSITTGKSGARRTGHGTFDYRHVQPRLFWGYAEREVSSGAHALVAEPEKALLDLVYLRKGSDRSAFLEELRLQNTERLEPERLLAMAQRFDVPKVVRGAKLLVGLIAAERSQWEEL